MLFIIESHTNQLKQEVGKKWIKKKQNFDLLNWNFKFLSSISFSLKLGKEPITTVSEFPCSNAHLSESANSRRLPKLAEMQVFFFSVSDCGLCGQRAWEPTEGMKARKTFRVGTWTPTSDMLHQLGLLPLVGNTWGGTSNRCGAQEMMHSRVSLSAQIINHRGALGREKRSRSLCQSDLLVANFLFIYRSVLFAVCAELLSKSNVLNQIDCSQGLYSVYVH